MNRIGKTFTTVAAVVALGATPAFAAETDSPNPRAQGAPGQFCKQAGSEPGSAPFRECVRLAAKARRQAQQGDQSGENENARAKGAPGRFCQANGADPGSEAFRSCVTTAAKARRAARS